ncbi:MAG TPA: hypothetical protein VHA52_11230, partial [Candidatus Babeliaceae bacterium]|nr:hypothetical protein [Candidatus Babeliaceae bacterium]
INYFEGFLGITVKDNGIGFDKEVIINKKGIGLKSIQSRAVILKGSVDITSSPQKGTVCYLEFDVRNQINKIKDHGNQSSDNR